MADDLQFIKVSHSAEAQSPSVCYAEQRGPMVRSQTDETAQVPKDAPVFACRPRTSPPESTSVAPDSDDPEPSSRSTGLSPIVLDISLEQPTECHATNMQVDVIQEEQQEQTQLQTPKLESFSETLIRQHFAKEVTDIYARLQSLCRFEEQLFAVASQTRACNAVLEKEYGIIKRDYDAMEKKWL